MHNFRKFNIVFLICSLFQLSAFAMEASFKQKEDTIPLYSGGVIRKSIYPQTNYKRPGIYNYLIGKHYRDLYSMPITVKSTRLYDLYGGLKFIGQLPRLHAFFMQGANSHLYMVRPLGGATTFMESVFFRTTYNRKEFEGTYLDKFIGDAYTITHPYAFMIANKLAKDIGVSSFSPEIYYIPQNAATDTVADGTSTQDRLVSVYDLREFTTHSKAIETEELLDKIQESKTFSVDQRRYIRERILDLLTGDWNKTKESWEWLEGTHGDSVIYVPFVSDRSHAFTKVDGLLFEPMLGVLGLSGITNYDSNIKNLKKANSIGIPLDIALVAQSGREVWYEEAKYIKSVLTDEVIDNAFETLPKEIYASPDTEIIKQNLKKRRDIVEEIVQQFYDILQQTPVVTGTNSDDLFVVEQKDQNTTHVNIYDRKSNELIFDKQYDKATTEIWLYGLDGNDEFRVSGLKKGIPLTLAGGKGENIYHIEGGENTDIYDYKSHNLQNDTLDGANMVRTDIEKVHAYDYKKQKYQTLSFTPWGVYDSDLGFYLGAYVSKTIYGFKQSPYSYQHRIGYNYLEGAMYQGFFPTLDEMKGFNIEAIFGVANVFQNFFGFGNETEGFKDKPNDYNRVGVSKYSVRPSFFWKFNAKDKVTASSMIELYNVHTSTGRYINQIYPDDNDPVYDPKAFVDLNLTYEMHKEPSAFVPSLNFSATSGWTVNVSDPGRNFPYIKSKFAFELAFNDRFSMGTQVEGSVLFSDKYEFYQAVSVELRGFRDRRFIGQQSLYQHTDFRYDLGRLKNPFTPIQYGVFVGFDYGRVWYPDEDSQRWHTSYGGGFWLTLFKKYTGKFSYFGSKDGSRFYLGLGMGF